jgi:tRNA threonylcarbamoyl adenosine modification protein YeaZ
MYLGIELAGNVCTVALNTPEGLFEQDFSAARGRGLLAAVDQLCTTHEARGKLEAIVVGVGPGSYTGLRIAASAANILAWAEGIPAIGISSFAAAAEGAWQAIQESSALTTKQDLHLLVDAFRGEWYHACYRRGEEGALVVTQEPRIVSAEQASELTTSEDLLLGEESFATQAQYLGSFAPRASALVQLAMRQPQLALSTEPVYLRETSYQKKS